MQLPGGFSVEVEYSPHLDLGPAPSIEEQEEFERRLHEATLREARSPSSRYVDGKRVIWKPQDGSQCRFVQSDCFEVLYHGTRGPGKTDALLMAFARFVGKGLGSAWRGIIFRQTYPQLADVQAKSEKWFRLMFPEAKFNRSKMEWEWPTGEKLSFRHMSRPADYWNYHGHEYPFIGWEELCNWANDQCYKAMFACCRSSTPGVPRMIRATTNPYGPGHNWVKDRFQLAGQWFLATILQRRPTDQDGNLEPPRAAYYGYIDENKILLEADPNYKTTIVASATNPAMAEAWLYGSWDIVAGGMFDDVWSSIHNVVPRFQVPHTWRLDRSFDWGSTAPFSVGWWAQSDGSDLRLDDGTWRSTVRGDIFRIHEWYGWNGHANQGVRLLATDIAKGIVERELMWKLHGRVQPGPADSSIHDVENGVCIAQDMSRPIRIGNNMYPGIPWHRADKRAGSRRNGWELMRKMIKNSHPVPGRPRELPGLFVVGAECPQFLRTVPSLPRDDKDMDDADSDAEDHIADETRYRVRFTGQQAGQSRHTGMY